METKHLQQLLKEFNHFSGLNQEKMLSKLVVHGTLWPLYKKSSLTRPEDNTS